MAFEVCHIIARFSWGKMTNTTGLVDEKKLVDGTSSRFHTSCYYLRYILGDFKPYYKASREFHTAVQMTRTNSKENLARWLEVYLDKFKFRQDVIYVHKRLPNGTWRFVVSCKRHREQFPGHRRHTINIVFVSHIFFSQLLQMFQS